MSHTSPNSHHTQALARRVRSRPGRFLAPQQGDEFAPTKVRKITSIHFKSECRQGFKKTITAITEFQKLEKVPFSISFLGCCTWLWNARSVCVCVQSAFPYKNINIHPANLPNPRFLWNIQHCLCSYGQSCAYCFCMTTISPALPVSQFQQIWIIHHLQN